ncbi:MAG: patatin-like phospholipase family protein [Ignavibacteria bacterium]
MFFCLFSFLFSQEKYTLQLDLVEKKLPFNLSTKEIKNKPRLAVALSGGGARGFAQIGVLKAFEEKGIPIDYLIGTSMGSIIGGLYSAGYSVNELDSIVRATNWNDFFSLEETDRTELFLEQKITEDKAIFALRLDGLSLVIPTSINTGQDVSIFLTLLTLNAPLNLTHNFDDMLYKFRAVCTDLVNGNPVVLNSGSLSKSMRASSSVSFFLPPVSLDSLLLVDGGLVANIPVEIAKSFDPNITVAVNTTSSLKSKEQLSYPWDIADQLISIPMKILNSSQLDEADFILDPPIGKYENTSFSYANNLIEAGYESTQLIADSIKSVYESSLKESFGEEKVFNNLRLKKDADELEKIIYSKIIDKNKVTGNEILYYLNKVYEFGNHKKIGAEIIEENDQSVLIVHGELNRDVSRIELAGINKIPEEQAYSVINKLLNKPYNANLLLHQLIELLKVYRNNGYSLANIRNISFNQIDGTLKITLDEGSISEIIIEGNEKTNESIIRREFDFKKNGYFKYDEIEKALNNLKSINLFEEVELFVIKENNENKLYIKIKEKPSALIRFGLRVDNEYFTQFSIDLRDENIFGSATELGTILSAGSRNASVIFEHKANRVFNTYFTYNIRAFYEFRDISTYLDDSTTSKNEILRQKIGEYEESRYGVSAALGTQVQKYGKLFVEGRFTRDEIENTNSNTVDEYKLNVSAIKFGLTLDSQDQIPYPTDGFLLNTYYETAQSFLGGEANFTKFFADYKIYFSINSTHTLRFKFTIGFADETLPLSQQFSFGGQSNFFGFREYDFRGRQIFQTGLEYRLDLPVKIFFDSYLKFRYDTGSIWTEREQIRFKDFRHGIGGTFSLDTPVGPADFSVGKSFDFRNLLPDKSISWGETFFYFSIGYKF